MAHAEPRQTIDLEPAVPYFALDGATRTQISVLSYTYGYRSGSLVPFVGGALGFFTLQARLGITWMPGDLEESGFMMRLDARPQTAFGNCWEPMVLGSLGAGWRWPLEHGDPGYPGVAAYLLPEFTGGVAFLHTTCHASNDGPLETRALVGGTLAGGFDF
jgi:hypothetical protein